MKEIPLTQGYVAIVDDEDYDKVMQFQWQVQISKRSGTIHAARAYENGKTTLMHRFILDAPVGSMTDHINRNGLDNRKENLRYATYEQQSANRAKWDMKSSSQYKGVYARGARWYAQISNKWLGSFSTEEEAAKAYDKAASERWGEYAVLNFPV